MTSADHATIRSGHAVALADVPRLEPDRMIAACGALLSQGERLAALFVVPSFDPPDLFAIVADDANGTLRCFRAAVPERRYRSLTATHAAAQAFEISLRLTGVRGVLSSSISCTAKRGRPAQTVAAKSSSVSRASAAHFSAHTANRESGIH